MPVLLTRVDCDGDDATPGVSVAELECEEHHGQLAASVRLVDAVGRVFVLQVVQVQLADVVRVGEEVNDAQGSVLIRLALVDE